MHEYYDVIVTNVSLEMSEKDAVRITFDTTKDVENGQFLILNRSDIVEIGKLLNLAMLDKDDLL